MNWRNHVVLFGLGFAVAWFIARYQSLPGYMDADYYFAGGIQLATGKGFTEPYIWNYLGDPQHLPVPSHAYWMPLASIISAVGMWLTSQITYSAGRLPFILLSACVPVLTATLAFNLSHKRHIAWTAGLLSVFSGFYAPFMPVPDNYAIYMLLGGCFLIWVGVPNRWSFLGLGVLAGLMTLARTDGLLWLGLGGLTVILKAREKSEFGEWLQIISVGGLLVLCGYLLVMGPWHLRNLALFGTPLAPGSEHLLWLTDYRETFVYPASVLTQETFLQAGLDAALQARWTAFFANLNIALIAQGSLFLLPFVLVGLWHTRSQLQTQIGLIGWVLLFVVMTLVFPFAGPRGSFHHAGAAVQPLLWVAAALGLEVTVRWGQAHGRFTGPYAVALFQSVLVLLMLGFTGYLVHMRVIATGWATDDVIYAAVEEKLLANGISPMDVVIVRNPPGYYVRTGRSAVILPYGDMSALIAVAERYQAAYVVLEDTQALGELREAYEHPRDFATLIYLGEVQGARLFRVGALP